MLGDQAYDWDSAYFSLPHGIEHLLAVVADDTPKPSSRLLWLESFHEDQSC